MNLLRGQVAVDDGTVTVSFAEHRLVLAPGAVERYPGLLERSGTEVIVGIRPEHFAMEGDADVGPDSYMEVKVDLAEAMGAEVHIHAEIDVPPASIDPSLVDPDVDPEALPVDKTLLIARVDGVHTVAMGEPSPPRREDAPVATSSIPSRAPRSADIEPSHAHETPVSPISREDPYSRHPRPRRRHPATPPNLPTTGCPFCPGGLEAPEPYDVRWFTNRWPAMEGERCEVVLYTPDHDATFASLGSVGARRVVDLWTQRTEELGAHDDVEFVLIFENRRGRGGRDDRSSARSDLHVRPRTPSGRWPGSTPRGDQIRTQAIDWSSNAVAGRSRCRSPARSRSPCRSHRWNVVPI